MPNLLRDYRGLCIDGKWIATESAELAFNPATEEVIACAPSGDDRTIEQATAAARVALDTGPWPRMPPTERTTVLMRFHDELVARAPEIASLVVSEHLR